LIQKLLFQFTAGEHPGFGRTGRVVDNHIIHLFATKLAVNGG
jgi:hypothetical protein